MARHAIALRGAAHKSGIIIVILVIGLIAPERDGSYGATTPQQRRNNAATARGSRLVAHPQLFCRGAETHSRLEVHM